VSDLSDARDARAGAVEALLVMLVTLPLAIWLRFPTLWFVAPFAVLTVRGLPYENYGLVWRPPGSLRFHLLTCLVIFGGYALLHYAFGRLVLGQRFVATLNPDLAQAAVAQFIVIGLSEEFFFRGYLQTRLNAVFGRPYRFLGVSYGRGLFVAALLFGLCHVVSGDFGRIRVAFFGLFAGWLWERSGTIAVPAAYHGFANLLYDFMARSMVE